MAPFTNDVESVELTSEEHASFARLVGYLCHQTEQHQISLALSQMARPQGNGVQDYLQRQARRMWRTEVRLLASRPAQGGEADEH